MGFGHFLTFVFALVFAFGGADFGGADGMRESGEMGVVLWAGDGGRGTASATAVLVGSRADSECLGGYTGAARSNPRLAKCNKATAIQCDSKTHKGHFQCAGQPWDCQT